MTIVTLGLLFGIVLSSLVSVAFTHRSSEVREMLGEFFLSRRRKKSSCGLHNFALSAHESRIPLLKRLFEPILLV